MSARFQQLGFLFISVTVGLLPKVFPGANASSRLIAQSNQQTTLSAAAVEFLNDLERAGWSGETSACGATITVRSTAIMSQGMIDAVTNNHLLNANQKKALADVAHVTFDTPGWFFNTEVAKGNYALGLEAGKGNYSWTLNDVKGVKLGANVFWVKTPTDQAARASASASNGAAQLGIACGNIVSTWRYVSQTAVESLTVGKAHTSGSVTIISDIDQPVMLKALAKDADAAVTVHATLLGKPRPKCPFYIHLVSKENDFQSLDSLFTDGAFFSNGAVSWTLPGNRCCVWYVYFSGPDAFRDHGCVFKIKNLVFHELHHLVAYATYGAAAVERWPSWLAEGLAETGAWQALASLSKSDGEACEELTYGTWLYALDTSSLLNCADLCMAGEAGGNRSAFYAQSNLLVRELAKNPNALHTLLASMNECPSAYHANPVWAEQMQILYGSPRKMLDAAEAPLRSGKRLPMVLAGARDKTAEGDRLTSSEEGQARTILPDVIEGDTVAISLSLALLPLGDRQADVYFAYNSGRTATDFLKVAIKPTTISLFRFRNDIWQTWGEVNFETELALSDANKRVWHGLSIQYDVKRRKVTVEFTNGRWAEFDCKEFVPLRNSRVGIGTMGSVAYFKDIKMK